jgi:NAD(P)-dependent dehydrogenase (short-subunit alcohol dehydrogenase family)
MHTTFEGKVALVTGAAGGIGLATAKAFALAGASVVVADHNEKLLNEAAEKLRGEGHNVLAVACDVSDKTQVAHRVLEERRSFGSLDCKRLIEKEGRSRGIHEARKQRNGRISNMSRLHGVR